MNEWAKTPKAQGRDNNSKCTGLLNTLWAALVTHDALTPFPATAYMNRTRAVKKMVTS
jgi:hypothetical protein